MSENKKNPNLDPKEEGIKTMKIAEEFFEIFIDEMDQAPILQEIVNHCFSAKSKAELFRAIWVVAAVWIFHKSRLNEKLRQKIQNMMENN